MDLGVSTKLVQDECEWVPALDMRTRSVARIWSERAKRQCSRASRDITSPELELDRMPLTQIWRPGPAEVY